MKDKNNKKPKITKLSWFTITRKYWKEQIIFWILTTLSAVVNYIMDANVADLIKKLITSQGKIEKKITFKFWDKNLWTFQNRSSFFWFMVIYITIYCLIVIAHVYYAFYLANKISRFLKRKISRKLFRLKSYNKEQILTNLDGDEKTFTRTVVHYPNQLYYLLLTIFLTFGGLWIAVAKEKTITGDILIYGAVGLVLVALICLALNYFVYKRDLSLQKEAEKTKKEENILVNKRNLIVKKNLTGNYQKDYQQIVDKNYSLTDKRDWNFTLAMVIPAFAVIPYMEYTILPLICIISGKYDYTSLSLLAKLYGHEKKMIDRLKDYSYYFSAKKRLNWLLNQPERDDYQKNILITEPVETVSLKNVGFAYKAGKPVLDNYNIEFQKGKINYLIGENGSGKSTTIDLIMGLHRPIKGEILINNKWKISEINLIRWREKIAYSEHENLIENGLSTGQKQLADLNNLFVSDESKEIFIFDEADNALDENKKKEFRQRIEKISKKKLVILISH